MIAPCGKPTKANRFGAEPAAVFAIAVAAGLIASMSGSAIVAPTPFNTVRREMCFLNRVIFVLRDPSCSTGLQACLNVLPLCRPRLIAGRGAF